MKRYEQNLIAQGQNLGLDIDPQHVAGNPEILWEIRGNIAALLDMPAEQRAAAVERANDGQPLRLSSVW